MTIRFPLRRFLCIRASSLAASSLAPFAISLAALALPGDGAAGQEPSTAVLEGQVVDSVAGEPIEGVLVRLDSGAEAITARDGRFRLIGLEPGPHTVALLTADCRITWSEIDLEPGAVDRRFVLPRAFSAEAERERTERRRSQGKVVSADEIRALNVRSLTDVIRRVAPSMVGSASMAGADDRIRSRSRNSFMDDGTEPVLVVDGARVADPSRALASIDPSDVERLEVLAGSTAGWDYGSDGAAGVIRVTTRLGRTGPEEPGVDACVVPDFPIG